MYESARDDDYLMRIDICPRGALITRWQKMSGEEPEQKIDNRLPDWLRVGRFVWMDPEKIIVHGGAESAKGVFRIESIENGFLVIAKKQYDKDLTQIAVTSSETIGQVNMRPVSPKPYTFDTAPVIFKARRKVDDSRVVLAVDVQNNSFTGFGGIGEHGTIFISFADVLRDYEQLDGWPCGTFDEEG